METKNQSQLTLLQEQNGGDIAVPYSSSDTVEGAIYAIDAYTNTVINAVQGGNGVSAWNGKTIPEGKTLYLRCTSISFTSGTGAVYTKS